MNLTDLLNLVFFNYPNTLNLTTNYLYYKTHLNDGVWYAFEDRSYHIS